MSCKKVQHLLVDYLDQELKEEDASFIQTHLSECASCSKELRTLEKLGSVVSKAVSPDKTFFEEMRRRLFEKIRQSRPSKERSFQLYPRRIWKPVLVPATLSLLLLAGLQLQSHLQERSIQQDVAMISELGEEDAPLDSEDPELLEEELALTDEFLVLAQRDPTEGNESIEGELELLNALGEGEDLEEGEGVEDIEQELSFMDEGAVG